LHLLIQSVYHPSASCSVSHLAAVIGHSVSLGAEASTKWESISPAAAERSQRQASVARLLLCPYPSPGGLQGILASLGLSPLVLCSKCSTSCPYSSEARTFFRLGVLTRPRCP
jgi:hypothetical protein